MKSKIFISIAVSGFVALLVFGSKKKEAKNLDPREVMEIRSKWRLDIEKISPTEIDSVEVKKEID